MSKSVATVSQVKNANHVTSFSEHIQNALSSVSSEPHELSIVLFRIADGHHKSELSTFFNSEIQNHIRATDSVGWLDTDHLAFVLPDTGSDGAADLLRRLADSTSLSEAVEDYWVISYPRSACVADAIVDYERIPQ